MKKYKVWLLLGLLCACGSPLSSPQVDKPNTFFLKQALENGKVQLVQQMEAALAKGEEIIVADVGKGKKTPASLSMKIVYQQGDKADFKTLASSNGTAPKTAANVQTLQVWLLDTAAAIPSGNLTANSVAGPFSVTFSGTPQTLFLDNVPPSTNQYFVAVAARDNTPTNITKATGATISGQNVAVSNGGGSGSGSVVVNGSYQVSSPNPLTIALQLLDGVGATIEARANLSDGGTPPPITARVP
jgi:hypothetical protein